MSWPSKVKIGEGAPTRRSHPSWGQKQGREDDGEFCADGEVAGETDHSNVISITSRT
jgi:hypothetical protein